MKNMKKLASLLLALVMVFSLATTAFAASTDDGDNPVQYSITIENKNTNVSIVGKEYKAYKVFDLTLGEPTTEGEDENAVTTYGAYSYSIKNTDWAWGTLTEEADYDMITGVITTKYGITLTPSASDATLYSVDGNSMTETNARELADALTSVLPTPADSTATAEYETVTIDLDKAGYYAVYGSAKPTDPQATEEVVAALGLTTTNPNPVVNPKVDAPTLDKKVTGELHLDSAGKAAIAQVGSTVNFEIDSVVPDLTGYSDYTFIITDTMTTGLTFTDPEGDATNNVVVKINNVDKTDDTTIAIDGQTLTVTIPYNTLNAAVKGQPIVVTYSAVVNENALTTDYEKNTAKLTYSNNPSEDTTSDTPDKTVYVIDVDINVDKVAEQSGGAKLENAKFKVFKGDATPNDYDEAWYKWDDTNKVVTWVAKDEADTFTTNTNGKFDTAVQGLEAGTYGLLETEAPTGYNLLGGPFMVYLYATINGDVVTVDAIGAAVKDGIVDLSEAQTKIQPVATATVINNSGTELPSTGGMGTTLFYVFGSILVIGAAVLLVTKKRMGEAQ